MNSVRKILLSGDPFITAYDARKLQLRRRRILKATFLAILKEIENKIKKTCKESMYQDSVRVMIPIQFLGYPIYNVRDAREYCKRKLERSGYTVTWPPDSAAVMIISWPQN